MAVGVAVGLVEQAATHGVLRIPGMVGLYPLVAAGFGTVPPQPMMFHVVHQPKPPRPHQRRAHPAGNPRQIMPAAVQPDAR